MSADRSNISTRGKVFPHRLAWTLLLPLRGLILSPRKLLRYLELPTDAKVLEIGPWPGYFSIQLAQAIPDWGLVLSDIQQEMLDKAKQRLSKKSISNVSYHLSNGQDFPFEDKYFDTIVMVTVLWEVEYKDNYLKECYRLLKPWWVLSISEQRGDADHYTQDQLTSLILPYGFTYHKKYGNKKNFTIQFKK